MVRLDLLDILNSREAQGILDRRDQSRTIPDEMIGSRTLIRINRSRNASDRLVQFSRVIGGILCAAFMASLDNDRGFSQSCDDSVPLWERALMSALARWILAYHETSLRNRPMKFRMTHRIRDIDARAEHRDSRAV